MKLWNKLKNVKKNANMVLGVDKSSCPHWDVTCMPESQEISDSIGSFVNDG